METKDTAYERRAPFATLAVIVGLIAYFISIITDLNRIALVAAVAGVALVVHGSIAFADGSMRDQAALSRGFSPVASLIVGLALLVLGISR